MKTTNLFIKVLTVLFTLTFSIQLFAQEKIYLSYFEAVNVHEDYSKACVNLLKIYLENENVTVVIPGQSDVLETIDESKEAARSQGLKYVLTGSITGVGDNAVVSVKLVNLDSDNIEWSTVQKTANPSDLDPILSKIAKSLINRSEIAEAEDIYNVTNYDSKQLNKKTATTGWGVEVLGGVSFMDTPNRFTSGFGVLYSGDLRDYIFDVKGFICPGDNFMGSINILINKPLWNKSSTPFVGGGIGYGASSVLAGSDYLVNNSGNGLCAYLGGGYIFTRTSDINLRINLNAFACGYEINNQYPTGLLMGISVVF